MCISVTKAQRTKATSPEARKPDRGGCSVVTLFLKPWWAVVQLELAPALTPCSGGTDPASSAPRGPAPGAPRADRVSPRETP